MVAQFISLLVVLSQLSIANAIVCPNSSFVSLGTYCVMWMGPTTYNVSRAQSICAAINSSLPTFLNATEQNDMMAWVPTVTTSKPWLGYYNNGTSGGYTNPGIWYDKCGITSYYIKWTNPEPNNLGAARCTNMYNYTYVGYYVVNDDFCAQSFPTICMWRPYPFPSNCITTTTSTTTPTTSTTSTTTTPSTTTTTTTTTIATTPTTTSTITTVVTPPTDSSVETTVQTVPTPVESTTVPTGLQMLSTTNLNTELRNSPTSANSYTSMDLLGVVIAIISATVLIICLCCGTAAAMLKRNKRENRKGKMVGTQM